MNSHTPVSLIRIFLAVSGTILAFAAPPSLKIIKAARLLDVQSGTYVTPAMILIEGERIKEVGSSLQVPKDAEITDLGDITLLPGLIDAHTHLLLHTEAFAGNGNDFLATTLSTITTPQRALRGAGFARDMLLEGFTTIRDLGNSGRGGDIALRDAINQGWVPGPRMLVSTRILTPIGGQFGPLAPEAAGLIDLEYAVINGAAEGRKAVRQAIYEGADVIKVVVKEGAASLDLEELKAIVAEAHSASRKVAVHAYDDAAARVAADASVDSIEHGYHLSEGTLRVMAQKGIWLVPSDLTASAGIGIDSKGHQLSPEEVVALESSWTKRVRTSRERLQMAMRFKVPLAAGSDVFFPIDGRGRGASSKTMLRAYSEAGLAPIEIIQMATIRAADLLGWSDRVGNVSTGKFADIIAVAGDPLKDISVLDRVCYVMKGGRVLSPNPPAGPATSPHAARIPSPDEAKKELEGIYIEFVRLIMAGKTEEMRQRFRAPDFVPFKPDGQAYSPEEIVARAAMKKEGAAIKFLSLEVKPDKVWVEPDGTIHELGTNTSVVQGGEQQSKRSVVRYMAVWHRQPDGSLKYRRDLILD